MKKLIRSEKFPKQAGNKRSESFPCQFGLDSDNFPNFEGKMTSETFHVITKKYKSGKKFERKKYFQCPQETFPQIKRNISRPKFRLGQCILTTRCRTIEP